MDTIKPVSQGRERARSPSISPNVDGGTATASDRRLAVQRSFFHDVRAASGLASPSDSTSTHSPEKNDTRSQWWHADLPRDRLTRIWKPQLWGRGPDGWPIVAIALRGRLRNSADAQERASRIHSPIVYALELSTGREVHTINGLTQPRSADFDGDGLVDLWGEFDGEIRAFRGETPELWQASVRLAGPEISDADGVSGRRDGYLANLLHGLGERSDRQPHGPARSGRDGRVIWKVQGEFRESSGHEYPGESSLSVTAACRSRTGT